MCIGLYDKVELKDGRIATIVEIYEQGKAYEADIETADDCITDTIKQDAIKQRLYLDEDLEVDNNITVETDLTDEEKDIIKRGRKEYEKENFVSLDSLN